MAAHAPLKNEFMVDEKCHNLMTWLISRLCCALAHLSDLENLPLCKMKTELPMVIFLLVFKFSLTKNTVKYL